jgi:hypothetical protein
MLPIKSVYFPPETIHCPADHLRMSFRAGVEAYRCNWPGCLVTYSVEKGYYLLKREGDAKAREEFYAREAICLCEKGDFHHLYIGDFVDNRKVRFWVCPVRGCGYEVSQRLEKTETGWRMCGAFAQHTAVRIRR